MLDANRKSCLAQQVIVSLRHSLLTELINVPQKFNSRIKALEYFCSMGNFGRPNQPSSVKVGISIEALPFFFFCMYQLGCNTRNKYQKMTTKNANYKIIPHAEIVNLDEKGSSLRCFSTKVGTSNSIACF